MKTIFATDDSWSCFLVRLGLAVAMFPHGAQKLLGWFGGPGFHDTVTTFTTQMHIPAPLAILVIVLEFFGPFGLVVGFLARLVALGLACEMAVAIALVHWPNGFFMNWMGKQAGEGFEYHLLVIAMSLAILIQGAGRWSIDREVGRRVS